MKIKIIGLCCLMFCFACQNTTHKKPENLIEPSLMTEVLYEMYLLNASKNINKITFEKHHLNPEPYIFNKFNIDSTQFAESNSYYANHLKLYKTIITEVQHRIKIKKEEIDTLLKRERIAKKRRRDSIDQIPDSLKFKTKANLKIPQPVIPITNQRVFVDSTSKKEMPD